MVRRKSGKAVKGMVDYGTDLGGCPACGQPVTNWFMPIDAARFDPCGCIVALDETTSDANGRFIGNSKRVQVVTEDSADRVI